MADWLLEFPAEEAQVPKWSGEPDEQQTPFLLRLLTLWQATKFSQLPLMSFRELKVEPWFAHRLVGDDIWNACWGARAPGITPEHIVPMKMMNILTHVVASMDQELKKKATEEQRLAAAKTIAEQQEAQRKRIEGKSPRIAEA